MKFQPLHPDDRTLLRVTLALVSVAILALLLSLSVPPPWEGVLRTVACVVSMVTTIISPLGAMLLPLLRPRKVASTPHVGRYEPHAPRCGVKACNGAIQRGDMIAVVEGRFFHARCVVRVRHPNGEILGPETPWSFEMPLVRWVELTRPPPAGPPN